MDGLTLKEDGQQQALDHADAVIDGWTAIALDMIRTTVNLLGTVTAHNVRHALPAPPHYNAIGAVFSLAARQGIIKRVGYCQAIHKEAHGRIVAIWGRGENA